MEGVKFIINQSRFQNETKRYCVIKTLGTNIIYCPISPPSLMKTKSKKVLPLCFISDIVFFPNLFNIHIIGLI